MNAAKIVVMIALFQWMQTACAQMNDSFLDGDFSKNPAWTGDQSKFTVLGGMLRLQASAAQETAFLSTPSSAIYDGVWEFYVQLDFNPSSSNFAKIFVVSDQANLNASLNGYFVKVGSSSREISLYRQSGNSETKIIDGADDRLNLPAVKMKIRVTRSNSARWQLFSDVGVSGIYVLEGSNTDNAHTASEHFGIHCTYTSTRSDKFWFDDFAVAGKVVPDTIPPMLQSVTAVGPYQVELLFSEPLVPASVQVSDFVIGKAGAPISALLQSDQKTVRINLSTALSNGISYPLQISGLKDIAGNVLTPTNAQVRFFHEVAIARKDVIFSELLPDPDPQIGLPDAEFAEIYNRSPNPVNLSGWKLSDGVSTGVLPSEIIMPGEYRIVTASSSAELFRDYQRVIGLKNFPTLNNSSDVLLLKDSRDELIDSIHYTLAWYRDADKQEGGWSLELIDPFNPCGEEDNWSASEDPKGGTPGEENSVLTDKPDRTPPALLDVFPELPTRLTVSFDEKLSSESLQLSDFALHPALKITSVSFKDAALRDVWLQVEELKPRQEYQVTVSGIADCNGNEMSASVLAFGLPERPDSMDVVINEILFNPRPGGVDFVEIYNASEKYLNLKDWKVGNQVDGAPANTIRLFDVNFLFAPDQFAVLTSNPVLLQSQYPQCVGTNLHRTSLPGLSDNEGTLILLSASGQSVDELSYARNWHSELIRDDEGVSLERIDVSARTNDRNNWTSASANSGFASPGFRNSQFRTDQSIGEEHVTIDPEIFSPGMGASDFVRIQYHFSEGDWLGNVKVFDQQAHLLKTISNNETLGPEGFFRWDGDRDDGSKARMGYYFVWFEIFNPQGLVRTFRKRVVVTSR